jgi:AcrR family transcriptional regulator
VSKGTYHHGDLRRAIVRSARKLIEERGPHDVSLRAIAKGAGVSSAAPYHHFDDRTAVIAAVATEGFRELTDRLGLAPTGLQDAGPLQRLQDAGIAYVCFANDNPGLFRLMFSGLLSERSRYPDLQEAAAAAFAMLGELVGENLARPPGEATDALVLTAWSTVHGLAVLLIEGRLDVRQTNEDAARLTREVTRVLGRGLRSYSRPGRDGG